VQTEFAVAEVQRSSELVDLNADATIPRRLAGLSGGQVFAPDEARQVLDLLGEQSKTVRETKYITLWDSWPLMVLLLLLASGEWIMRKRVGLP
jgi:hypothetical protein